MGNHWTSRRSPQNQGFQEDVEVFFGLGKLSSPRNIRYFAPFSITTMILVLANWMVFAANTSASSPQVKEGSVLFQKNCIACHNKQEGDTSPFGPPNLHGVFRGSKPAITPQQAVEIIKDGRSPMPSFENTLAPAQINALVAYLKTQ
jgi:mono/diheme cytochrome c family protein